LRPPSMAAALRAVAARRQEFLLEILCLGKSNQKCLRRREPARLRRPGPLRFSASQARCPNSLRSDTGQLCGLADLRCSARFRRQQRRRARATVMNAAAVGFPRMGEEPFFAWRRSPPTGEAATCRPVSRLPRDGPGRATVRRGRNGSLALARTRAARRCGRAPRDRWRDTGEAAPGAMRAASEALCPGLSDGGPVVRRRSAGPGGSARPAAKNGRCRRARFQAWSSGETMP